MNQPGSRVGFLNEEEIQRKQPQMRPKQSNYSMGSEMSFSAEVKKPKSKSFNRKQGTSQQQVNNIMGIYQQLQYSPQMRNMLRKFCYLDKQKLYKVSVTELKQFCERELKRIDFLRRNNVEIQRFLQEEDRQDTDNQLSLITITCQIKSLVDAKNQLNVNSLSNTESMAKTRLRQYESILLEVQKSDETIRQFINSNLKLREHSDINIAQCKTFFRSQAAQMSQSSDRMILSRRTLCQIIIFLCRLLQGEILAFDDHYEYQEEQLQTYEMGDENNRIVVENRTIRNNRTIVQNLDQSFSDNNSQKEANLQMKSHSRVYKDYSNDDLGKKVNELAGICEQIPQLEAFTRTLKFSKITLQNRESFFKIVDVIIALHHKIGYLSRNKPTLLREIETIQHDLTEVYESIREFVASLMEEVPQFKELDFKGGNEQDSKHQLTETLSYLRKDLKKLSEVIKEQNINQHELEQKLQLLTHIIQAFCQSIHQGEQSIWKDLLSKLLQKNLEQDQTLIVNWLSQCHNSIHAQLKNGHRHNDELQTERNLQAEVHTLLADYERLRGQHQELQSKYSALIDQKDEQMFDIGERDNIISNLASFKIAAEKRQNAFKDQLKKAQHAIQGYEHDMDKLQHDLQMMSIQNQNRINDLQFQHQNELKRLINDITNLERHKTEILSKYEEECSNTIKLLQDIKNLNKEIQTLKDRLQKRTKDSDETSKKGKDTIYSLEKEIQELKTEKSLLQNKLELAQRNKNKLIQKLQEVNSKYSDNSKDLQEKYEHEAGSLKQANYKMEKQLEKYRRSNGLLTEEIQHLRGEVTGHTRTSNDYRQKLMQLNPIQGQLQTLSKEYQRLLENYHKSQTNCDSLKKKLFDLTSKHEQLLEHNSREKDQAKRLQKKCKDFELKLDDIISAHQGVDRELRQQQKINKILQKKISELESENQLLQQSLHDKDKNYLTIMNKSELKYQQINEEQTEELEKLRLTIRNMNGEIDKKDKDIKALERNIKEQSNDFQLKEMDWLKIKSQLEKKLKEKQQELNNIQAQLNSSDEQSYNQSILLQQIKTERNTLQLKLTQLESAEKEKEQLKKNIQNLQQNQDKLNNKIQKLQNQINTLNEEIENLRSMIKQKERQLKDTQQQLQDKQNELQRKDKHSQNNQSENNNTQISQLKEQILIEKTIIIKENNHLQQQNNNLQTQIDRLKALNEALQANVRKLQQTLTLTKEDFSHVQTQLKQTVTKHLFTITSLQNQLQEVNAEKQLISKDYDELQHKFETKSKQLAEKDNLLFEKELQKGNSDKLIKELKFRNSELQNIIETLNQTIQKLKNGKIKVLQTQISQLNDLVAEWRRKQENARSNLNDLQGQMEKVKRDSNKKVEAIKQEKAQLDEHYQNQLKKLAAQHQLQLSALQNKTRKDTEHQYNQLLIKEKETFNHLTISKMEELGEMQRKYEKLIREERAEKNLLQEEYNRLQREFNDFKRTNNLNTSRAQVEESDNTTLEEMQKLKSEYESLKRENARLTHENARLAQEGASARQQNTALVSKLMESEHSITILTSKLNLQTQNLQNTKKSLQQMNNIEIQKLNLQRELEKLRLKTSNDQSRINDYKVRIEQMEGRISELQGKLKEFRNKQSEWERNNSDDVERIRLLTAQSLEMSQKHAEMKQLIADMTQRMRDRTHQLQTVQVQLQVVEQRSITRENELNSIRQQLQNQISSLREQLSRKAATQSTIELQYKQFMTEWELKQAELQEESQAYLKRIRELEIQLNHYKLNSHQATKLIDQLTHEKTRNLDLEAKINKLNTELAQLKGDKIVTQKENQILKNQISQLNTQKQKNTNKITKLNQRNSSLTQQNDQLSRKIAQLINQINQLTSTHQKNIYDLEQQLLTHYENQKNKIIANKQGAFKPINENLKKEELRANQMTDKYKKALQQMDQINILLEKLRRENMQLSDHCKKYEERIQILQIQHKNKGQINFEIQSKYLTTQKDKQKLQETNRNLLKQIEKLKLNITTLQSKLTDAEKQNLNLKNQLGSFHHNITDSTGQIQRLLNENRNLQHQLLEKSRQIQRLNVENNQSLKIIQQNSKEMGVMRNDNQQMFQKFKAALQQIEYLQNSIDIHIKKLAEAQSYIEGLKNQNNLLQQKLKQAEKFIDQLNQELKSIGVKLFQIEGQKNSHQHEYRNLVTECQKYKMRVSILQSQLQRLEGQKRQTQTDKQSQETFEVQRLKAELALTRQEILRLHEVIKKKEQDFDRKIQGLTDEKASMWKDNQALAQQYQVLKNKFSQLEIIYQSKGSDFDKEREQRQRLAQELDRERMQRQRLMKDLNRGKEERQQMIQNFNYEMQQKQKIILDFDRERQQRQRLIHDLNQQKERLAYQLNQERKELERLINEFNREREQRQRLNHVFGRQGEQKQKLVNEFDKERKQKQRFMNDFNRERQEKQRIIIEFNKEKQERQRFIIEFNREKQQRQRLNLDFERERQQRQRLNRQIENLRTQLTNKIRQITGLNQLLSQSQRKQQQLTRTLINQQTVVRQITLEMQSYKGKISTTSQQAEDTKLNQNKLKDQINLLERQIARLKSELGITRMEYERLYGEHNQLTGQLTSLNQQRDSLNQQLQSLHQQNNFLTQQLAKQKGETQRFYQQCLIKQQTITTMRNEFDRATNENNTKHVITSNVRQDLEKANREIVNMRATISRLQKQNHDLTIQLNTKQKMLKEIKDNVDRGSDRLQMADREIKNSTEEKARLLDSIRELTKEKDYYLTIIKNNQVQSRNKQIKITTLMNTITILQTKITQLKSQIQRYESNVQFQLSQSRSAINLVTKSYSYQGGQLTVAELHKLEEQIRRLITEIQNRDKTIQKDQYQIQKLNRQIRTLREQIHLLSEGKTINIKGYTRVTNPNDNSLNTKGVIYTEYDVRELKAKVQLLEKSLARYQDRETELLRQIQKYKFRERAHLEQIRGLSEKIRNTNNEDELPQITSMGSPKKTSFDQYNINRSQSSTYRLQTGIEVTQRAINMTKKENKDKEFLRVEGEQLRRTIERISNSQQIMSIKIDEIIDSSRKVSRENLEHVLSKNEFNLTTTLINEIRDLIHQNKALIETLRSLKQYREDVSLLIQQYIDPELLTEFVHRILTYFSEVEEQSVEALAIREELNSIRKNNVGGYYFTVLEEYTKYILQNNSIQIYKEELIQKAREFIIFKEKFQSMIDSKLEEKDKLLKKSDSKGSLLNKSRTKYMASSHIKSGQNSREASRIKQYVSSNNRLNLLSGQQIPPHQDKYSPATEQKTDRNSSLNPMQTTLNRSQIPIVSSRITYAPHISQTISPINTPTQPVNQTRTHVIHSTTTSSSNYISNGYTIKSSNLNVIKPSYERK